MKLHFLESAQTLQLQVSEFEFHHLLGDKQWNYQFHPGPGEQKPAKKPHFIILFITASKHKTTQSLTMGMAVKSHDLILSN